MTSPPDRLLLEPRFDAAALLHEAKALGPEAWVAHFNTAYYEGDWSGVALRSPGGSLSIYPDPAAAEPYADTFHLERCPAVRSALAQLRTPLSSARFLRLGPGARIREHRDYQIGLDYGEVRLHVPLETNDEVSFVLGGRPLPMRAGDCWYVDVTQPHSVYNGGSTPRIHLVVDCAVNDWLRAQLAGGERDGFARFTRRVVADAALQDELWAFGDGDSLAARTVELGLQHGFAFETRDVTGAIDASRRRAFDGINR